jgi:hypothetical protein
MEIINRKQEDIENIKLYLESLKEFTNFIYSKSNNKSEIIPKISECLKYEKIPENRVICKFGEKGQKFYLILQGSCFCLLPDMEQILLTQYEYFDYLIRLKKFKEKDILNKILPLNKNAYELHSEEIAWLKGEIRHIEKKQKKTPFEEYFISFCKKEELNNCNNNNKNKDIDYCIKFNLKNKEKEEETNWKIFEGIKYQNCSLRYEQANTVEEYIKNTNPIENITKKREKGEDFKEIFVYFYHNICKLTNGNKFGDLALISVSQKRTATIISNGICHLGILDRRNFMKIINDINDLEIRKDIRTIQHQQVFSTVNVNVFQWNYLNKFFKKKMDRGDLLISEGNQVDNIYIIKKGLFEVTIKNNNIEFLDLISKFSGEEYKKPMMDELTYGKNIRFHLKFLYIKFKKNNNFILFNMINYI